MSKKCYICKKSFKEEDITKVLNHNICKNCYPTYIRSEEYLKAKFIDDVWRLYPNEKPNFYQLQHQAEELHELYGFTYGGMSYALEYWLKFNVWNTEYMLHQLFPKAYYEARKYWEQQSKLKQSAESHKELDREVEVVKANTKSLKPPLALD